MGRPRTPIGVFGEISFTIMPSGNVRARTRFRDDDVEIRKIICTTNAIESLNARYRRAVRARATSPTTRLH
jgi:transposase-like protein